MTVGRRVAVLRARPHRDGIVIAERTRLDGISFQPAVLKHDLVEDRVRLDDGVATAPVHAHDIDELRILAKERCEQLHVVGIPRPLKTDRYLSDFLLVLLNEGSGSGWRLRFWFWCLSNCGKCQG